MQFRLPKPLHGWRELVGEIGIIVVGVLIALGAQQSVEAWQWRNKVAVVRTSIMSELGNDRARWEVDMAQAPCLLREIAELDRWAQGGTGETTMPATPTLANPAGFFWMHSANWNLATGSEALDHFPVNEQLAFAALYDGIAHREVYIEQESDLTQRVLTLRPLAKGAQKRDELRDALGGLSLKLHALANNEAYMKRHFDALGVRPDRSDFGADFTLRACAS